MTFGAVALSLSACEGTSAAPSYGHPGLPLTDAAADADAARKDASFGFPPGRDAEADAETEEPDASDADADATNDASIDSGAD